MLPTPALAEARNPVHLPRKPAPIGAPFDPLVRTKHAHTPARGVPQIGNSDAVNVQYERLRQTRDDAKSQQDRVKGRLEVERSVGVQLYMHRGRLRFRAPPTAHVCVWRLNLRGALLALVTSAQIQLDPRAARGPQTMRAAEVDLSQPIYTNIDTKAKMMMVEVRPACLRSGRASGSAVMRGVCPGCVCCRVCAIEL